MIELFVAGIVGLCVGSAVANYAWHWQAAENAADEATGKMETMLVRRSACEACGTTLGFIDLLPVAGWFIRRGRCAYCAAPIPAYYWPIELMAGLIAPVAVATLGPLTGGIAAIVGWMLLLLERIDTDRMILPDALTLPLLATGFLASLLPAWPGPQPGESLAGALAGFGLLYGVRWSYFRLRGREGLGLGDVKLFAAAGAWCGLAGLPNVLVLAAAGVLVPALISALFKGKGLDGAIAVPFGPALAAAFWLQLLWSWPLR